MGATPARAGVAVGDITPPVPVALAGYGDRDGLAESVHDRLDVRVLVLGDDDGIAMVLVVLDLLLLAPERADPLRRAVADRLAVPVDAVLTTCVHVHGGPSTIANGDELGWPEQAHYLDQLTATTVAAAASAARHLEPVEVAFGREDLPAGVAVNRRGHAFEPSVAVLDLVASADGRRIATLVGVGMHPTVAGPSNRTVSTDWVGPCRRALEAAEGGVALVVQGCGGDVNPAVTSWEDGDPAAWAPVASSVGASVAATAAAALSSARAVPVGLERRPVRWSTVPLDPATLLSGLYGGGGRDVELHEWRIGDVTVLSVPGEGFHHLEQAVRANRGDRVLLVGLAPDWHGYLPVPFEEGYEESLSYGPGAVSIIGAALVEPVDADDRHPAASHR